MPKYKIYGKVVGTKFIGVFEADTKEQAIELANEETYINLCHQCSKEVDDAQIVDELDAEEITS